MEKILDEHQTRRTEGQNCVEMLLGRDKFMEELAQGAFFLLEDWAIHWDSVVLKTFGDHPQVVREIFQQTHKYLLCIYTPCSHDFSQQANAIAEKVGLPVKSIHISLDGLEKTLEKLLKPKANVI